MNAADWTTATREDGLLTAYGYDGAGQQRTQTILNSSPPVTTTLNAEGLETSQVEGLAGQGPFISSFGYNQDDLPVTETLPGGPGVQLGYRYDGDSRLITQTLSGPATATVPLSSSDAYGYNPASWTTALTSTLNGLTTTQTYTHDALGRLTGVQGTDSTTPLSVTYVGNGNILSTVSNGVTTTYYYSSTYPNLWNEPLGPALPPFWCNRRLVGMPNGLERARKRAEVAPSSDDRRVCRAPCVTDRGSRSPCVRCDPYAPKERKSPWTGPLLMLTGRNRLKSKQGERGHGNATQLQSRVQATGGRGTARRRQAAGAALP